MSRKNETERRLLLWSPLQVLPLDALEEAATPEAPLAQMVLLNGSCSPSSRCVPELCGYLTLAVLFPDTAAVQNNETNFGRPGARALV